MSKLVLHSDQIKGQTEVDRAFLDLLASKNSRIGYIPSQSDPQRKYFNRVTEWYKQFGITDLLYFDADKEYDEQKLEGLLSCDAIHLSGGNTYSFLNSLKSNNLLPKIRDFVKQGGILIGVSAGSIVMAETIDITKIDDDIGGDQNTVGIKDLSALGLTDFEFFPHIGKDENTKDVILRRLQEYSERIESVVYACKDGDGIVVDGNNIRFFGNVLKIEKGQITTAK